MYEITIQLEDTSGDEVLDEAFLEVLTQAYHLWCSKHKSYGSQNISKFGSTGVLVRASDKIERLIQLLWHSQPNPLEDESIQDTWMDLGIYAFIALLIHRGKWPGSERVEETLERLNVNLSG